MKAIVYGGVGQFELKDVPKPRLEPGGLFVSDNVLWHGRVTQKEPEQASTRAIQEFNRMLYSSRELFPVIVPLRDGVAVAVKESH